jgi:hypothetical protein
VTACSSSDTGGSDAAANMGVEALSADFAAKSTARTTVLRFRLHGILPDDSPMLLNFCTEDSQIYV